MRWLFNCMLVIAGLPLLGITLLLIMFLVPAIRNDFGWLLRIYILTMWLFCAGLFVFIYKKRAQWLEKSGIFKSWSNFKAYMKEGHRLIEVPVQMQKEFMAWANLKEEHPPRFQKIAEQTYKRIKSEIKPEEKQKLYIQSLVWYMRNWLPHEEGFGEK